jgi:hypothetical protein
MVLWTIEEMEMMVPSWFSLLGCASVILTYAMFYELRRFRHIELVFFVTVNDFFATLGTAFGFTGNGTALCWYQGFTSNFNYLSSAMWTVVMGYQLIFIVYGGNRIEDLTRIHCLCFFFPLIVALLPLTTNTYGNDGEALGWCFIGTRKVSDSCVVAVIFVITLVICRDLRPGV